MNVASAGVLAASLPTSTHALCAASKQMLRDVGEGGYSFRASSNQGSSTSETCLQHVVSNHPGNTAVRVDWYIKSSGSRQPVIANTTLRGCFDAAPTDPCDCNTVACQVTREQSSSEPVGVETLLGTIGFGVTQNQYLDEYVPTKRLNFAQIPGAAPATAPTIQEIPAASPEDTGFVPDVILPEREGYPKLTVRVSGFPATSKGVVLPIDLFFQSEAYAGAILFPTPSFRKAARTLSTFPQQLH